MGRGTLIYGHPLIGKSTLLVELLKWHRRQKPGLKARLYTAENYDAFLPAIKAGVVDVWEINKASDPFAATMDAAKGMWPEDTNSSNPKMVAPTSQTFEEFGLFFYEGLSTYGEFLMSNYAPGGLAARAGKGDKIGPMEDTVSFSAKSGNTSYSVGGNKMTHYTVVQGWVHGLLVASQRLPIPVVWTAHETEEIDKLKGLKVAGPTIVGVAATQKVPKWVGATLHLTKDKNKKRVLYLKDHPSMFRDVDFKATTRVDYKYEKEIPDFIDATGEALSRELDKIEAFKLKALEDFK